LFFKPFLASATLIDLAESIVNSIYLIVWVIIGLDTIQVKLCCL